MTAHTDEDATAAVADVIHRKCCPDDTWDDNEVAEAILAAVAPAIAARALREAADDAKAERLDLQKRNRPEYDQTIWNLAWVERRLRARAEQMDPMPDTFAGAESERQA